MYGNPFRQFHVKNNQTYIRSLLFLLYFLYLKLLYVVQAVANSTSATFLRVVGSELIQKYLGDGPKLVRELFRVADDLSPSIVFIDEIDAVGTKRYDAHSGGEREIQRTRLELLNQLDGFDSRGDVKVILATNKIESLDPALLRPGRIDRKIEFPLPDIKTRRRIFQVHCHRLTVMSYIRFIYKIYTIYNIHSTKSELFLHNQPHKYLLSFNHNFDF
ncbi:putative proteasome endopeptidase complex [Helianthus annuus]|nr:putative proteasome endopeptidase complex [Helianthus annuus]KAJ0939703.1 putative proteasome endopeptidase complex [Helianthus annuus]